MPACFSLTLKGAEKASNLVDIDEELCQAFGEPIHLEHWFRNWYNLIGFCLAMGDSFDQVRERLKEGDTDLREVIDWLEERYDPSCWRE